MAHDQRYCLQCGARRGPAPPAVSGIVAGARAPSAGASRGAPLRAASAFRDPWPGAGRVLAAISPRAAALATMSMLAFGVIVGSGASSFAASSAPLLLAVSPTTPLAPAPAAAAPSSSSSSPSQSSGPAPAAAPAPVTATPVAQTVTEPAPATNNDSSSSPPPSGSTLPPIKHVFVVMLSDQGYKQSFGDPSNFPYLARTLRHQGELLENYYAVAPSPLSNAIAMISGQGPTVQTAANCPVYTAITPTSHAAEGQVVGTGCVYPVATQSLPDQLTANGDSWKAYVEGIGNGPAGTAKSCRRPTLDAADTDQAPQPGDPYVTWRNPFVYFQSLTQSTGCNKTDVGMQQLFSDLKSTTKTPSLSYIVPSPCEDGSEQACPPATSTTGSTSSTTTSTTPTSPTTSSASTTTSTAPPPLTEKQSTAAADKFLQYVIPRIERSPAYKSDGMIAITFDEAPQTGPNADPSACCNNPAYPNLPASPQTTSTTGTTTTAPSTPGATPTGTTTTGTTSAPTTTGTSTTGTTTTGTTSTPTTTNPLSGGQTTPTGGGGQVGLLLLSKYVKPNSFDEIDYYNHYSLLASIEQLFSLPRLGYATDPQLPLFDTVTYNAYKGG